MWFITIYTGLWEIYMAYKQTALAAILVKQVAVHIVISAHKSKYLYI